MLLFFFSTWGSSDCSSNLCESSLCTDARHWCTMPGHFQNKWQLTFRFFYPHHSQRRLHTFPGHQYKSQRDRGRPQVLSTALRSWLPAHKLLLWRCCPVCSRWRCLSVRKRWRQCQRNPLRGHLWWLQFLLEIMIRCLQTLSNTSTLKKERNMIILQTVPSTDQVQSYCTLC